MKSFFYFHQQGGKDAKSSEQKHYKGRASLGKCHYTTTCICTHLSKYTPSADSCWLWSHHSDKCWPSEVPEQTLSVLFPFLTVPEAACQQGPVAWLWHMTKNGTGSTHTGLSFFLILIIAKVVRFQPKEPTFSWHLNYFAWLPNLLFRCDIFLLTSRSTNTNYSYWQSTRHPVSLNNPHQSAVIINPVQRTPVPPPHCWLVLPVSSLHLYIQSCRTTTWMTPEFQWYNFVVSCMQCSMSPAIFKHADASSLYLLSVLKHQFSDRVWSAAAEASTDGNIFRLNSVLDPYWAENTHTHTHPPAAADSLHKSETPRDTVGSCWQCDSQVWVL